MQSMNESSDKLDELSKEELIKHIKKKNEHINQLKNLLNKKDDQLLMIKKGRAFDFSKYKKKRVALKFFYLGWNYEGFVEQEHTKNSVEDHLFTALLKARLIENKETSNYSRCGRTDNGVSAFSQVISLDLRSKLSSTGVEEIKYCNVLNKILPKDIRCICSSLVDQQFSARFSCKSRTYRYFFPIGTLDLELMKKAANYFEGTHDFRNFCKLDKSKLKTTYVRTIDSAEITKFRSFFNQTDRSSTDENSKDIYQLQIKSSGFLWHQIRCIVAVLFCIGERKERPEIVLDLMDLNKFNKKPQYSLANELPLVLYDCEFDVKWEYDEDAIKDAIVSLTNAWIENSIKSAISLSMLNNLEHFQSSDNFQKYFVKDLACKTYKKFTDRPQCDMQLTENAKNKLEQNSKHKLIEQSVKDCFKKIKLIETNL